MAEQFSSEKVFELLFDDDFYLSGGYSSDEECSEGHSYLGNNELHPQDWMTTVTLSRMHAEGLFFFK